MEIRFKKKFHTAYIRSPSKNFEIDKQLIEIREDPLTKEMARINANRIKRINFKQEDFSEFIETSKKNCPLCTENIETHTPKFADGKRIYHQDIKIFPNLFPYSPNHVVLVMTKEHYLPLNKIDSRVLSKSFDAALKFFKQYDKMYPSLNFNYMPPAAASLLHPHMQLIAEDKPLNYANNLIKRSKAFYKKYKENFWVKLVETERMLKERFIGECKHFIFLSKYAPRKTHNILIISKEISSLIEMEKKHSRDIAKGLENIFKKMSNNLNINSLNMSSFSAKESEEKYYRLNFEVLSRPRFRAYYTSDLGFMEFMQDEPVIETLPEDVAKALYFGKLKG